MIHDEVDMNLKGKIIHDDDIFYDGIFYGPYVPLTTEITFMPNWEKIGTDMPTGKTVYHVKKHSVIDWVESQPTHMWDSYTIPEESIMYMKIPLNFLGGSNYTFTDEMESWFMLRWS